MNEHKLFPLANRLESCIFDNPHLRLNEVFFFFPTKNFLKVQKLFAEKYLHIEVLGLNAHADLEMEYKENSRP